VTLGLTQRGDDQYKFTHNTFKLGFRILEKKVNSKKK